MSLVAEIMVHCSLEQVMTIAAPGPYTTAHLFVALATRCNASSTTLCIGGIGLHFSQMAIAHSPMGNE